MVVGHSLHCITSSSSKGPSEAHCSWFYVALGTSRGAKWPYGCCPLAAALSGQPAGEGTGFILDLSLLLKKCNPPAQSCC